MAPAAVDVHAHFLPPAYRRALARAGIARPDGMTTGFPDWSPEPAVSLMDAIGVGFALLSISSPGVLLTDSPASAVELAAQVNDAGAHLMIEYPDRFGFLASLPLPDVDAALAEMARALDGLNAAGIVLMTNYAGRYLGDELFAPIWAELNRRHAVVALHPTSPAAAAATDLGRPRPMVEFLFDTTRAVLDLVLSGRLADCPDVKVIVPHAGAVLPLVADRVDRVWRSTSRGEIDVVAALRRLYYDTAGGPLPRVLPVLLDMVAPAQVVFGSDYPFTPAEPVTAFTDALRTYDGLPAPDLTDILTGNARKLFAGRI